MKLKKSFAFGFITLFSLTLAACGNGGAKTDDSGSSKTADGNPSGEQIFKKVELQEISTADLSKSSDVISGTALNNVYEGLYRLDLENKPQPAGAAEFAEVSKDGLTYRIKLNEKSKWNDGKPVKAADYVYGWQRTVDPETASEYGYLYALVKNGQDIIDGKKDKSELGIKSLGDYELEITLNEVTPYFEYLLAFPSLFPQRQDIVEKYGKDYASTSENAVYNGPFVLDGFSGPGTDIEWSYKKNKEYWDSDAVKLDEVKVSVVKEAPTALNLFQDGQVDDVTLTGELAQQMKSEPTYVTEKLAATRYLEMNQRDEKSPFRNENLRKAISYSIDRKALVESILGDGSVETKSLVPADMSKDPSGKKDFSESIKEPVINDKKKAKEYWEKAKKELKIDKFEMDILASDNDSTKKVIEYMQGAIQDNLEDVKVTVSPVPLSVRIDRSNKGDFSTVFQGWIADYADPSSFLDLFVTGNPYNRGKFSDVEYDKLLKSAGSTNANDPEKRWNDMIDAANIMNDKLGVVPLYQEAEAHLTAEKVKDVGFHSAGSKYDFKWTYISE